MQLDKYIQVYCIPLFHFCIYFVGFFVCFVFAYLDIPCCLPLSPHFGWLSKPVCVDYSMWIRVLLFFGFHEWFRLFVYILHVFTGQLVWYPHDQFPSAIAQYFTGRPVGHQGGGHGPPEPRRSSAPEAPRRWCPWRGAEVDRPAPGNGIADVAKGAKWGDAGDAQWKTTEAEVGDSESISLVAELSLKMFDDVWCLMVYAVGFG